MSKQSKINPKSMSLLAVQGLDWCLRKAFLLFFLIMGTLFLNSLCKTMPGQQALLFISVIEGIYLASFTFRVRKSLLFRETIDPTISIRRNTYDVLQEHNLILSC